MESFLTDNSDASDLGSRAGPSNTQYTHTFVMPNSDLTVDVTFKAIEQELTNTQRTTLNGKIDLYDVTLDDDITNSVGTNDAYTVTKVASVTSGTVNLMDNTVKLELDIADVTGYTATEVTFTYGSDECTFTIASDGNYVLTEDDLAGLDGTLSVNNIIGDLDITIKYETTVYLSLRVVSGDYTVASYKVDGQNVYTNSLKEGDVVEFVITPTSPLLTSDFDFTLDTGTELDKDDMKIYDTTDGEHTVIEDISPYDLKCEVNVSDNCWIVSLEMQSVSIEFDPHLWRKD